MSYNTTANYPPPLTLTRTSSFFDSLLVARSCTNTTRMRVRQRRSSAGKRKSNLHIDFAQVATHVSNIDPYTCVPGKWMRPQREREKHIETQLQQVHQQKAIPSIAGWSLRQYLRGLARQCVCASAAFGVYLRSRLWCSEFESSNVFCLSLSRISASKTTDSILMLFARMSSLSALAASVSAHTRRQVVATLSFCLYSSQNNKNKEKRDRFRFRRFGEGATIHCCLRVYRATEIRRVCECHCLLNAAVQGRKSRSKRMQPH